MSSTTEYFKNLLLAAAPDTVYAAIYSGGAPGVGSEISPATIWGSGSRPAVALAAPSGGTRKPSTNTTLGTVDPASTAVTNIAFYDAAVDGNLLGEITFARTVYAGDPVQIPSTQDVLSLVDAA